MSPAPEDQGDCLFAYGSLIVPHVLHAVTGIAAEGIPALLPGYARFKLQGECYPGIHPAESSEVEGVLYSGLSEGDFVALDRFEDDVYERVLVTVATGEGPRNAFTYVVPERHRECLSAEPWDLEQFVRKDLAGFLSSLPVRMAEPKLET